MTYRRCICHPDDLPGVGISSGWVTANSLCHPYDILFHFMSSGWLNWGWFLIRMSYGNVIMSSGWDTLPFLSHPDEIANFDFPQHAVALQRFRRFEPINARCGLGKPTSRLTSLGESNFLCSLPECALSLRGSWHVLPHLIAAVQPKLVHLNNVVKITYTRCHKDACDQILRGNTVRLLCFKGVS